MDLNDIHTWITIPPNIPPGEDISDFDRAVEEWEEEFMFESEEEYERVSPHAFWVQDFDLCDAEAINNLSREEFDKL